MACASFLLISTLSVPPPLIYIGTDWWGRHRLVNYFLFQTFPNRDEKQNRHGIYSNGLELLWQGWWQDHLPGWNKQRWPGVTGLNLSKSSSSSSSNILLYSILFCSSCSSSSSSQCYIFSYRVQWDLHVCRWIKPFLPSKASGGPSEPQT